MKKKYKKITIKNIDGYDELLEFDEIVRLLRPNFDGLILLFESGKTDDEYRRYLQEELPNHHVFNLRWMPEIWVYPSIETEKILDNKEEIYQAARSFREEGLRLMQILGKTYQINPFETEELLGLKRDSRANKQRGKVNEVWNFWFHGTECQFKNHITGQIVELVILSNGEFGTLDSYFFLRYLKTTPEFKDLAKLFVDDNKSVTKALNVLEDLGMLTRINDFSQRGIIAL